MKKISVLLIAFLIVAWVGSSNLEAKSKQPGWLTNPENKFPSAYYLTAIGEGDSRAQAENMAVANISRIFESKVMASESIQQRYEEMISSKGANSSESTEIIKDVNISSEQTLMNLKFADSYTDEVGRVFALAYIDRMKTGSIYENRINEIATQIVDFIKQGDSSKNYIISYAYFNAAKLFDEQIKIMMAQLDIISATSKDMIELGYDSNELTKKLRDAAQEVTFSVDIKNDEEDKMKIVLEEMFTAMGFKLSENSMLKLVGSAEFAETDLQREDYIFVRYDLKLKVIDDRGDVVAVLSQKGREGHASFTEAKARCIRKLESKIDKKLKKKIIKYFDDIVK